MTRVNDIAIDVCVAGWIASVLVPLAIPNAHVDVTISLVLMAIVGGLIAIRQRREESTP